MMKTEFIAWWGAILSTVVLAWDVFKWRRGKCDLIIEAVWGESLAEDEFMSEI